MKDPLENISHDFKKDMSEYQIRQAQMDAEKKFNAMNNCGHESELSLLRSKVERLERLLRRNLECMKFINGPDNKCLLKNVDKCPNHRLIHETEAALSDVGIISSFDGREWKRSPTPEDRLHGIGCGCCPCHHDTTCKWYKKGSEGEKA